MKPDAISRESGRTNAAKGLLMSYGSMAALVLIILVFSLVAPNFLSLSNLTLMLGQVSVVGVIALHKHKYDFGTVCGIMCGSMANPMALNYVNDTIEGDNPSVSYATVYPVCMFLRVIIIQVMLMLVL